MQLCEVYLDHYGHPAARYVNARFDLCANNGGQVADPSDTILWMANGTGKTTLIGAVLSLLEPARAKFIGSTQKKPYQQEDLVHPGVPAHLAVRLRVGAADQMLPYDIIIGQVLWWVDGVRDKDHTRCHSRHYGFRVTTEHPDMGSLPTRDDDGNPRSGPAFLEALRGDIGRTPGAELLTTSTHHEWRQWLADHHIEDGIVQLLLDVNVRETSTGELFSFESVWSFAESVLDLTTDPTALPPLSAATRRLVDAHTKLADQRRQKTLYEAATGPLTEVAGAVDELNGAWERLRGTHRDTLRLQASLDVASDACGSRAEELQGQAEQAEEEADKYERDRQRYEVQAAAASFVEATLREQLAAEEAEEAEEAATLAGQVHDAWQLVPAVVDLEEVRAELENLEELISAAGERADAARRIEESVSGQLASRIAYDIGIRQGELAELDGQIERHNAERNAANEEQAEAAGKAKAAEKQIQKADDLRGQADRTVGRAVRDGWLERTGEPVAAAVSRWAQAAEDARRRVESADEHRRAQAAQIEEAEAAIRGAENEVAGTEQSLEIAQEAVTRLTAHRDELLDDSDVQACEPHPSLQDGKRVAEALAGRREDARSKRDEAGRRIEELSQRITRIEVSGIDVDEHVAEILDQLADAGIAGVAGWDHIAKDVAESDRRQVVARDPAAAAGVVLSVADPSDAAAALSDYVPPLPVTLVSRGAVGEVDAADGRATLLPADHRYDPAAAERLLEELRDEVAAARDEQEQAAETFQRLRAVTRSAERFVDTGGTELDGRVEEVRALQGRLTALQDTITTARETAAAARVEKQAADDYTQQAKEDSDTAHRAVEVLADVATDVEAANAAEDKAAEAHGDLQMANAVVERLSGLIFDLTGRITVAAERRGVLGEQIQTLHSNATRNDVRVDEAPPVDDPESLQPQSKLEEALRQARRDVQSALPDEQLLSRREGLHKSQRELVGKLEGADEPVQARARTLAATPDAGSATSISASTAAAHSAQVTAEVRRQKAAAALKEARDLVKDTRVEDLQGLDEELTDPDQAAAHARTADKAAANSARAADEARETSQMALREAEKAESDGTTYRTVAGQLQGAVAGVADTLPNESVLRVADFAEVTEYSGTVREAQDAVRDAVGRVQQALGDVKRARSAVTERGRALVEVVDVHGEHDPSVAERLRRAAAGAESPAVLLGDLEQYVAGVNRKLETIDSDRQTLARSLAQRTKGARDDLLAMERLSTLPDGLGPWSGHSFVRVRLGDTPNEARLTDLAEMRLQQLLDAADESLVDGSRVEVPAAMDLLLDVLKMSAGQGGLEVELLKPEDQLVRLRRQPIHAFGASGGETATAAVLLFCTLVQVQRARRFGTDDASGLLLLDNPLGEVSGPMVSLQRRIGETMGVQLVYTTHVRDNQAVAEFPRVISVRRRNGQLELTDGAHDMAGWSLRRDAAVGA